MENEEKGYYVPSEKSRTVLFLLCTFLGGFGAHRFYAGKKGSAIAQLLLTLSVVGAIISGPWVFYDWIVAMIGRFEDEFGYLISKW